MYNKDAVSAMPPPYKLGIVFGGDAYRQSVPCRHCTKTGRINLSPIVSAVYRRDMSVVLCLPAAVYSGGGISKSGCIGGSPVRCLHSCFKTTNTVFQAADIAKLKAKHICLNVRAPANIDFGAGGRQIG